mmetsp:Transcript_21887/g.31975  ORF Transcript_21887/g.31975 Transcript_21887/m.31975 type:complete len:248 (-) Transcript_21887:931-1674(-)
MREERHKLRHFVRIFEHDKAQHGHGGPLHVVGHVRHGDVQQSRNLLVVGGPAVRETDGEHSTVSQDGVLVPGERVNQRECGLFLLVHKERQTNGMAANDLLVVRGMCVWKHHLDGLACRLRGVSSAHVEQSHGQSSTFTSHGVVARVQRLSQQLHVGDGTGRHASEPEPEARAVDVRRVRRPAQGFLQVRDLLLVVLVRVDEAESKEGTALTVLLAWVGTRGRVRRREVRVQNCHAALQVSLVYDAE